MAPYLARRVLLLVPTLLGIALAVFLLLRALPGDPAVFIATRGGEGTASEAEVAAVRERLGLADPLPLQFGRFLSGIVTLQAGDSLWTGRPVFPEVLARLPLTLELALLGAAFSVLLGVPLGLAAAVRRGTLIDHALRLFTLGGVMIPNFWLAALLVLGLSVYLQWSPPLGYTALTADPLRNLEQLAVPALALGYRLAALVARMTRSALLEVLGQDYVRTARAKGLGERGVVLGHGLRNTLLPVITVLGVQAGSLLAGAVVMETVFTLPGMGRLLVDAVQHRDYPTIQGALLVFATLVALVNLVVDTAYAWADPRVRHP